MMVSEEPPIPLTEISTISSSLRMKLEAAGVVDLVHLFYSNGRLQDAIQLAERAELSIREAMDIRQKGRQHMVAILEAITKKKKVEPLELLWKVHWLLGIVSDDATRQEALAQETAALTSFIENLDQAPVATIDQILVLLIHRTLARTDENFKEKITLLIEVAERFRRDSLLAYQIVKANPALLALAEEKEPTQRIVKYRKLTAKWGAILQALEQRDDVLGQKVVTIRRALDNLHVLDLSEKHLKERVQQTMGTKKLRRSQLTHITTIMNAAVDLRDAIIVSSFAERASQIWFELAQGKPSKALTDDLLRSLRFARTAIFHYRALDDSGGAVTLLQKLAHLLGEFPSERVPGLREATTGVIKTFINTAPLLDRPVDESLVNEFSQRIDRVINLLVQYQPDERQQLYQLHADYQRVALNQLIKLGIDRVELQRGFIQTLLKLSEIVSDEEQERILNEMADHANQLLLKPTPKTQIPIQDLEVLSAVASSLAQLPSEKLSKNAQKIISQSHELAEQRYFQTQDPKIKAQLALQLLLSNVSPNLAGILSLPDSSKELDKLEEYASTAMIVHVKEKHKPNALKAGSILTALLQQKAQNAKEDGLRQQLKDAAQDFAEKTLTFMPAAVELDEEVYRFALLLLRSVTDLVRGEKPSEESKWIDLLTRSEQLAQNIAKAAEKRNDPPNQLLALSAAASSTAYLATIVTDRSRQARLLTRATTQIQKTIKTAVTSEKPEYILAAFDQYDRIMRARLNITHEISAQSMLFDEWKLICLETEDTLNKTAAKVVVDRLQTYRILNAEIPQVFTELGLKGLTIDAAKRKITTLLREASKQGDKEQVELAKQLDRRWAFQLDEDTLLMAGFRLEDAETSFTLADERFRISLQIHHRFNIAKQPIPKERTFPYLRPSKKRDGIIWYDETPVLYSLYEKGQLHTWLTLEAPTEECVPIGLWIIATSPLKTTIELEIPTIETLNQGPEGVKIKLSSAELFLPQQPTFAEHREEQGILIYEWSLTPGHPEKIPILVKIE